MPMAHEFTIKNILKCLKKIVLKKQKAISLVWNFLSLDRRQISSEQSLVDPDPNCLIRIAQHWLPVLLLYI